MTTNAAGTANGNRGSAFLSSAATEPSWRSPAADDLGPTDTDRSSDVYVRDLRTGTTRLASARADGEDSGNAPSRPLSISPDGTKVAFASYATDLGPHDSDTTELPEATADDIGNEDVYVHDLTSGTTTMVSTNAAGTDSANGSSPEALFSPDGSRPRSSPSPPTSATPTPTRARVARRKTSTSPHFTAPTSRSG